MNLETSDFRELPTFSIVVPTYERPERLAGCIQAVSRLDYPHPRVEVIVVDDGTAPPTRIESILAPVKESLHLRLLRQHREGPAAARNLGAAHAQHDYLAFTDDDCTPRPLWLKAFAAHFLGAPDTVAGGRTENAFSRSLLSTASQSLAGYLDEYYRGRRSPFYASNNLALSRALFHQIGGFDTGFPFPGGEDREFCDRSLHLGHRLDYVPGAVADHHHALSTAGFLVQHFNYGRGAYVYRRARAAREGRHIRLEPPGFYLQLLRYPFRARTRQPAILVATLLFLAQVATALGFFAAKLQRREPISPSA